MTLPAWLLTAVPWAVVSTGALVLLALCCWASIAAVETACRYLGLWPAVTEALLAVLRNRRVGGRKS